MASSSDRDPWAGCPPEWLKLIVECEGRPGQGHRRKFLGRRWMRRFADGFLAVAFDPYALHIEATRGDPGAITEQEIAVIGQRW